ncbi:hypothetical protein G7075_19180 [Phycicoccus sp. HDW14]|uniref:hypothetical protein n=1 Tax=Phycicoccus sp. HDW14 TaxID=2714941 RepID=UPI00140C20D2|nr:hypothetical protein [Phycicoccus sp. HDW14]QIM22767.1 hypothetical protein G7075_19180 [Phycicoccus sp. HDW14]
MPTATQEGAARSVRAGRRTTRRAARNRRAAWTLVVLTPLVSELALGSTPVRMAWLVLLWMPVYGAGVLLVRELVTRRGRGWPSILLLGLAHELVEDGIGLQALTSPHLYDAASWGARVLGVNLPYWEANAVYHVVFTVAVPIALTELLFPGHRGRPWLGPTGTTVAGVVALLGLGLLRVSVPPSEDPGSQAPLPFVLGVVAVVVVLGVLALVVVPPRAAAATATDVPASGAGTPSPVVLAALGAGATLLFVGLSFPLFGADQPAGTHGMVVLVPMALTLLLAVGTYRYVTTRAAGPAWTDRHTLGLVGGALVGHTLGGAAAVSHATVDRVGLAVIAVLTVVAVLTLDRRLRRRAVATPRAA